MSLILNLRGTNGSGKSFCARSMLQPPARVLPAHLASNIALAGVPCLTDGYTVLVGSYPQGKSGGCDRVKTFDLMRGAIESAQAQHYPIVVFESITVSTVFGSWADFCYRVPFWWVYLDTPLATCLERITQRNGGADFNAAMVADKFKAIAVTKEKARHAGFVTHTLKWGNAPAELRALASLGT